MAGRAIGGARRSGWIVRTLQAFVLVPGLGLLAMAIWFQFNGQTRIGLLGLVGLAALGLLWLWWQGRGREVWLYGAVIGLAGLGWYQSIRPSNDRAWTVDVEHGVTADIQGNIAVVDNVRNFDWRTTTDFTPRWETRRYDIDTITEVDLFTSTWGNPSIAHVMIGFGFEDGQRIVFSSEIRRTEGEAYSTLAGFFRRYELIIIAAEESDVIRLRTDVRDDPPEIVSLFPLTVQPEKRKELFLEYLSLADALSANPEWYNTATTNCTTVPWRLARALAPQIPLELDVLLSGHFPRYLHNMGVLSPGQPLDQVLAAAVRKPVGYAGPDGAEFSRLLRAAMSTAAIGANRWFGPIAAIRPHGCEKALKSGGRRQKQRGQICTNARNGGFPLPCGTHLPAERVISTMCRNNGVAAAKCVIFFMVRRILCRRRRCIGLYLPLRW